VFDRLVTDQRQIERQNGRRQANLLRHACRKRNRPIIGLPIILSIKPSQSLGRGDLQRYERKIYSGSITLINDATLRIEACVLGILCGGENGVRAKWSEVLAAREPRLRRRPF
jgi:hypothetical protein